MKAIEARFWAKVDKTRGCWNWTGATTPDGYGKFRVEKRFVRASRFAYETMVEPLDPEMRLGHTCENELCVRPEHMQPMTPREIMLKGMSPTANNAAKTMCDHGHPLSGKNLYLDPDGRRKCVTCKKRIAAAKAARFRGPKRPKPGRVVLRMQMERMNNVELGEHYGVTDTTIRNWMKSYGLSR